MPRRFFAQMDFFGKILPQNGGFVKKLEQNSFSATGDMI